MGIIEIIIIGIGLSMDAVCVCLSNGICMENLRKKHIFANALMFGFFQGLMPIIGYFTGELVIGIFSDYSNILVAAIFLFLGGKMLFDAFFSKDEDENKVLTPRLLLIQAIATSIDALAVGISFAALNIDIYSGSLVILIITTICCIIGGFLGKRFYKLSKYSTVIGGLILIFIGVKIFIEHTS